MRRNVLRRGLLVGLSVALVAVTVGSIWRALVPQHAAAGHPDLTGEVNPFVGTASGGSHFGFRGDSGDTFPGAAYPLGMVQWSPDTVSGLPGGYYYPDTTITGFSLTHFSGRGCTVYQDIPFMPFLGSPRVSPPRHPGAYYATFSHRDEEAHPGYYRVHLGGLKTTVELTVTARTGMARLVFPAVPEAGILINAGGSVNGNTATGVTIDPSQNAVSGSATSVVGCGSNQYTVYFVARFDHAFSSFGTWKGDTLHPGRTGAFGGRSGAFIAFDTTSDSPVVQVRVGISYVSVANADANLAAESSRSSFDAIRSAASAAWNTALSSIQIQGGTADERVIFYTALYHVFFHPNVFSDANGEYLGFDGRVHLVPAGHQQYTNIPGWDGYRSLIRLRAILDPATTSDILQSLVNDAEQGDGHLPRWVQANSDSRGMNGDDGDPYIASAFAFGASSFDTAAALNAMLNGQPRIREGYADERRLGYVAARTSDHSAAMTLEYATDDASIAAFAAAIRQPCVAAASLQRSHDWRNLFNPATGYIEPRNLNGSWPASFDPTSQSGFQEGDAAQYTWMVPFDLPGLFAAMGGNTVATHRLNTFFTRLDDGPTSPYAFLGNEPSFEAPWEFDFSGAPSLTQRVVRRIELSLFSNTPGGLPGNDDGGALSSWYIFAAIGLYPELPGVGGFVVGSPLFPSVALHHGGYTLRIVAPAASDRAPYIESLNLDGQPISSLWIPWSRVAQGATLTFTLRDSPSSWASAQTDAPPSLASVLPARCVGG